MISERINRIVTSTTMKIAAEAIRMKANGIDVINLSVGEPDFPTPENIKAAAKKAIDNNQTTYTINAGTVDLRKAIAEKFRNENNLSYSLDEIIVSSGAKQSVFNAVSAVVDIDDEVIIPAPYWVSYPEMVTLAHGRSVIVNCPEETGFKLSPELLEKAISPKTKLLILCNPSNPTGATYTEKELHGLAAVVEKGSYYIIADEIYERLVYDTIQFKSFASISNTLKQRIIVVNGVSKTYAMTGWRIGYAAGPEKIIAAMGKIQSHTTSNACSISQHAAVEAILGSQDSTNKMILEFKKRRDYLFNALCNIDGISCYKSEGAFYLFPNVSSFFHNSTNAMRIENSFDLSMYLLHEAKVAVVPGSAFGAEGFIRVSYASSMDNLIEAVKRIKEALLKLH
ncbi:MAG: pyridoxal phosphate-dependent aminotransferase [Ignavibacteriaceae bacterium]|nr:pyridoxal phosphate-dependent aminotransferase [Ignavibacteriaceae bacterium]